MTQFVSPAVQTEAHITDRVLRLLGEVQVPLPGGRQSELALRAPATPAVRHEPRPAAEPARREHPAVPGTDRRQTTAGAAPVSTGQGKGSQENTQ